MELLRGLGRLRSNNEPCVATIGAFDGIHRGHQAVIAQLLEQGRVHGVPTTLVSFEPLPREYFAREVAPARIQSFREKYQAISELGVDRLVCLRFNEELRSMSADAFARGIFIDGLHVSSLVIGDDFRFGLKREGDADFIRSLGEVEGFECHSTKSVIHEQERVSSSRLRCALEQADFRLAGALLGRPYSMSGRVAYGKQLGRTIGAPTANIVLRRKTVPLNGVFAVKLYCGAEGPYAGVANVGVRPTLGQELRPNLEVHLIDWEGDLYGKRATVDFYQKIRDEKKFDSLDLLKTQIQNDVESVRRYFASSS
ncbi:MAG: bifunctional riboflavin kinase/FAD synthetase [Pseudomonadota bacterium]